MTNCIACGSTDTLDLLSIDRIPVLCNELHNSPESASRAPVGRMDLSFCRTCGHYFNRSFDAQLMYYSADYETSLYASEVFREYAQALVERLVSRYDIRNKRVLEIGCGRGEFLRQLCSTGMNTGIGFDTSTPLAGVDPEAPNVSYVQDYFSADYPDVRAELIVCQQVLEHVEDPREFLRNLAETATFREGDPVIYFEVPNGLFTAEALGIWDLIYEHVSYFTPTSLKKLFEDTGFEILHMAPTYGDQYLYIEARLSADLTRDSSQTRASQTDIQCAEAFSDSFQGKVRKFSSWINDENSAVDKTFIWGAGSKGITFCNLVDPESKLAGLIDRNTQKQGKHIAETGIEIYALEAIDPTAIANVVIMNPQYTTEIGNDLKSAGVHANIISVMDSGS